VVRLQDLVKAPTPEGRTAGQEAIQRAAQAVDIGADIGLMSVDRLLRRDVIGRTQHLALSASDLDTPPIAPEAINLQKASLSATSSLTASTKRSWALATAGTFLSAARKRVTEKGWSSGGGARKIRPSTARTSLEIRDRLPLPSKFSLSAFDFTTSQSLVKQNSAQRTIESSAAKPDSVNLAWYLVTFKGLGRGLARTLDHAASAGEATLPGAPAPSRGRVRSILRNGPVVFKRYMGRDAATGVKEIVLGKHHAENCPRFRLLDVVSRSEQEGLLDRCQLPVASCPLSVASCQLPVASCQLPVASCQLPVAREINHESPFMLLAQPGKRSSAGTGNGRALRRAPNMSRWGYVSAVGVQMFRTSGLSRGRRPTDDDQRQ